MFILLKDYITSTTLLDEAFSHVLRVAKSPILHPIWNF